MPRRADGYTRTAYAGLIIAGIGAVGFAVGWSWTPAYQGPATGIGQAVLMMACMAIGGLGLAVALIAVVLGAVRRQRRQKNT